MNKVDTILVITSNTGSLFHKDKRLYEAWKKGLVSYTQKSDPLIVILTFQEFGGKNPLLWEDAAWFLSDLYDVFQLIYPTFISCVDCDMNLEQDYTALCTLFLAKESISQFQLYNFSKKCYCVYGPGFHVHKVYHAGDLCHKEKFPIELFPHNKWSRKGFMIGRVRFDQVQELDIINLHLIHDSNCLLAVQKPSIFETFRKKQLEYILQRLEALNSVNAVLCGDFNFRTSFSDLLNNYNHAFIMEKDMTYSNSSVMIVKDIDGKNILASVSPKELRLVDKFLRLDEESSVQVHKKSDKEYDKFHDLLYELPIHFLPTYCFAEDPEGSRYDHRRCPSWCDRIMFRGAISEILVEQASRVCYESFGHDQAIGDHKPVATLIPLDVVISAATTQSRNG